MEERCYKVKVKVSFETEFNVKGELTEDVKQTIFECLVDDAPDYLADDKMEFEEIK